MNSTVNSWALRWGICIDALTELDGIFGITHSDAFGLYDEGPSEAYVQSRVRLEAAAKGVKLWRNNVGVLQNPQTGQPVRYGLANDSKALNSSVKSGDLIGWRPIIITPSYIGHKIAQFVSRECKKPTWHFTSTEREKAQLRWIEAVNADGGDARFVTGEGSL